MKVELHYSSGSRVGWSAELVVNGRGPASCFWTSLAGEIRRSTPGHDFGFDAAAFEQVFHALSLLSAPPPSKDGAPVRRIRCNGSGDLVERQRAVTGSAPNAAEAEFDRVWFELFIRVRPVLLDIGMPEEVLDEAS